MNTGVMKNREAVLFLELHGHKQPQLTHQITQIPSQPTSGDPQILIHGWKVKRPVFMLSEENITFKSLICSFYSILLCFYSILFNFTVLESV